MTTLTFWLVVIALVALILVAARLSDRKRSGHGRAEAGAKGTSDAAVLDQESNRTMGMRRF